LAHIYLQKQDFIINFYDLPYFYKWFKSLLLFHIEMATEPRPLNWWIKSTQTIHTVIKSHIENYNELNRKKITGTVHVTIAKRLKTSGLLSSSTTPSPDIIIKEFNKYVSELEDDDEVKFQAEQELNDAAEQLLVLKNSVEKPKEDELVSILHKILKDGNKELIIRRRRNCCLW